MVFQSLYIILVIKKTHIMHIIHREDPIKKSFRGEKKREQMENKKDLNENNMRFERNLKGKFQESF